MASALTRGPERASDGEPLRLMIVDDSIVARTVLQRMLESCAGFTVAAVAQSAEQALRMLGDSKVDIVLLDVVMPGTDGLTALPEILKRSCGARVLILSSSCAEGDEATIAALALGAADTLRKPAAASFSVAFRDELVDRLRRIGPVAAAQARSAPATERFAGTPPRAEPLECIAVGASTGGIHAVTALLEALPADLAAPVLITQHLPGEFMPYFATQLAKTAGRAVTVALDGQELARGSIIVAPGDGHLRLRRRAAVVRVQLDRAPSASGHQPSVDPMLESVAELFGATAVGVVLSGMGRDGVLGARVLAEAGGEILVQDPESSTIWGMPGAVARGGFADAVLAPSLIGRRVAIRAGSAAWR